MRRGHYSRRRSARRARSPALHLAPGADQTPKPGQLPQPPEANQGEGFPRRNAPRVASPGAVKIFHFLRALAWAKRPARAVSHRQDPRRVATARAVARVEHAGPGNGRRRSARSARVLLPGPGLGAEFLHVLPRHGRASRRNGSARATPSSACMHSRHPVPARARRRPHDSAGETLPIHPGACRADPPRAGRRAAPNRNRN